MSLTILGFIQSFATERLSTSTFVEGYAELWRIERDKNISQEDGPLLSECLSSIFCVVDLYNPSERKKSYELNEEQLREQISDILKLID